MEHCIGCGWGLYWPHLPGAMGIGGEAPSFMRDWYLRGELPRQPTQRQVDVLAALVSAGGSVADAAALGAALTGLASACRVVADERPPRWPRSE